MRVVFESHRDFLREITLERNNIRGNVVRARVDRLPEQDESITFSVWLHLSAVVAANTGEYVIEFSGLAGSDDEATPKGGTERVNDWTRDCVDTLKELELELRPGKIEFV